MKKILLSSVIYFSAMIGLSTLSHADILGFTVGAFAWQQQFSGDIQSGDTGDLIDIEDTLGFGDETNSYLFIALEHPVPLIPNIMLSRTEMEVSASQTASFEFDGISFDGTIDSSADLSHTDATLYYEFLDNWVSLDLGLTVRSFDQGFKISGQVANSEDGSDLKVDGYIPMIYAGAKFELPLTGLYLVANGNWTSYDDDKLMDYKVALGYETDIGLGIEAGLRSFEVDYKESGDEFADITIDGVYAGVFYHF